MECRRHKVLTIKAQRRPGAASDKITIPGVADLGTTTNTASPVPLSLHPNCPPLRSRQLRAWPEPLGEMLVALKKLKARVKKPKKGEQKNGEESIGTKEIP